MFVSELELKSQLEDWFEQSCLFERVTVECYRCVVREEPKLPELVCHLQASNKVDVEDKYLFPRIDIWMNQSFGIFAFSEIDAKSGCLWVSVGIEDVQTMLFKIVYGPGEYCLMSLV